MRELPVTGGVDRDDECASNQTGGLERSPTPPSAPGCGKTIEEISRATPPGVEAQHAPSLGRFSRLSPLLPDDSPRRESMLRHDSASEGDNDSDDDAEPVWFRSKSGRRGITIHHRIRRSPSTLSVSSNSEYEAEEDGTCPHPSNTSDAGKSLPRFPHSWTFLFANSLCRKPKPGF